MTASQDRRFSVISPDIGLVFLNKVHNHVCFLSPDLDMIKIFTLWEKDDCVTDLPNTGGIKAGGGVDKTDGRQELLILSVVTPDLLNYCWSHMSGFNYGRGSCVNCCPHNFSIC